MDFDGKKESSAKNFGGGGGTGLSITPVGFLTVKADGSVEMVNMNPAPAGTVEQIADVIERSPEIFAKIKAFFSKKDKTDKQDDLSEDAPGETVEVNIEG